MKGHLITAEGHAHDINAEAVKRMMGSSTGFWLDLEDPSPEEVEPLFRDTFRFHPLAIEDADHFGQRPKIDTYDEFALLVVYGLNHEGRLVEVHCFYTDSYLVTVHRDHCQPIGDLCQRLEARGGRADTVMLLYRVIDALVDSYFPLLSALDDRIDELEDEILVRPTEQQLGALFDLKRQLIALRKVVTPQRDMFASLLSEADLLPGMTDDAERYFRDLYDHLIRISDLVDSYRDLMSGVLDTHLSTVSNRLNVVMKQLTIIATVFLPATFVTGFFGQNFGWMIGHISSFAQFMILGVAFQVVLAIVLVVTFRRRGWLSTDAAPPASTPATRPPGRRVGREHRWRLVHPHPPLPVDGPGDGAGAPPAATGGTALPRSHP